MDAHLIDSAVFGHSWSTSESRSLFSEAGRIARWLRVVQSLALSQAELGIIPDASAKAIAALDPARLDPARIAAETRRTSHSALGFIAELRRRLPAHAREHVYYGTTVQDVTDTSAALEMAAIGAAAWRDLWAIEGLLLGLARTHAATPMLGRTHGQPGAPISFGLKAASWADETGRHLQRLRQARPRLLVGQLAGAVGALGFYGNLGLELRRRFCHRLGLGEPAVSWLTARDRLAELAAIASLSASTMARVANEVYNLQRGEIGELSERSAPGTVGSITMPHKRNPENSEQIVVLARLVRSAAGVLTETMVGDHERDGRTWKAEWVVLPELGHYLLALLSMARTLVEGLEVNTAAMEANLAADGCSGSQELLRRLSARLGKHQAQSRLQSLYRTARESGRSLREAAEADPEGTVADALDAIGPSSDGIGADGFSSPDGFSSADGLSGPDLLSADGLPALGSLSLGQAPQMAEAVVRAGLARRRHESEQWT